MTRCAVESCNNYFHKKCAEESQEELPENVKNQVMSPVFVCGQHHCHLCSEPFRLGDQASKCIKCVAAYHNNCMFEFKEKEGSITRVSRVSIM